MTHSLFIVSFRRDFEMLKYLLASIGKFVTGFDEIVILVPHQDKDLIKGFGLTRERVEYFEEGFDGHLAQQWAKCNADLWCRGRFITHLDSDCLVYKPVTPETYLRDGNPIILMTRYDVLNAGSKWPGNSPWRWSTERCLGFPADWETMRRLPITYRSDLYPHFRSLVKIVHGKTLAEYLSTSSPHANIDPANSFSEFNCLGMTAINAFSKDYYLLDTEKEEAPDSGCCQFWSRGGPDWICDHDPFKGKSMRQVAAELEL